MSKFSRKNIYLLSSIFFSLFLLKAVPALAIPCSGPQPNCYYYCWHMAQPPCKTDAQCAAENGSEYCHAGKCEIYTRCNPATGKWYCECKHTGCTADSCPPGYSTTCPPGETCESFMPCAKCANGVTCYKVIPPPGPCQYYYCNSQGHCVLSEPQNPPCPPDKCKPETEATDCGLCQYRYCDSSGRCVFSMWLPPPCPSDECQNDEDCGTPACQYRYCGSERRCILSGPLKPPCPPDQCKSDEECAQCQYRYCDIDFHCVLSAPQLPPCPSDKCKSDEECRTTPCECTDWKPAECGCSYGGAPNPFWRRYNRTCTPTGCAGTFKCEYDSTCCQCTIVKGDCGKGGCKPSERNYYYSCNPPGCSSGSWCQRDDSCCACNWTDWKDLGCSNPWTSPCYKWGVRAYERKCNPTTPGCPDYSEYKCVDDPSCCECSNWAQGGCGQGGCTWSQQLYVRQCSPSGCDVEKKCVDDPNCVCTCTDWKPGICDGILCKPWQRVYYKNCSYPGSSHPPDCVNQTKCVDDPTCGTCNCSDWTKGNCGQDECTDLQRLYTRTCTPQGCDKERKCEEDPTCGGGPPPPSGPNWEWKEIPPFIISGVKRIGKFFHILYADLGSFLLKEGT